MVKLRRCVVKLHRADVRNNLKSALERDALPAQRMRNNKNVLDAGAIQTQLKRCVVRIKKLKCAIPKQTSLAVCDLQRVNSIKDVQYIGKKRTEFTQRETSQNVGAMKVQSLRQTRLRNIQRKSHISQIDTTSFNPPQSSTIYRPATIKNRKAIKNPGVSSEAAGDVAERLDIPTRNVDNSEITPAKENRRIKVTKTKQTGTQREQKRLTRRTKGVFDFASESPTSSPQQDRHRDPAADVIQRMINNGKVSVATLIKGRGKTRLKPVKKKQKLRPVGKRKKCSLQEMDKQAASTTAVPLSRVPAMSPIYEMDSDCNDYVQDDPKNNTLTTDLLPGTSKQLGMQDNNLNGKPKEDTIKNVPHSELVNRLKKTKHYIPDRRKLLDMARKIVSTPVNKEVSTMTETTHALHTTVLSPIALLTNPKKIGAKSPWRVSEDAMLPNTFNFGLNSSNLPSYSSDYISSTPQIQCNDFADPKNTAPALVASVPFNNESAVLTESVPASANDASYMGQQPQAFNSNDSNGENIAPNSPLAKKSRKTLLKKGHSDKDLDNQENEDFIHLPNPRRTLQYRSPFKAINVLEVVILPSWKQNTAPNDKIPINKTTETNCDHPTPKEKENMFGFDDFLYDTEPVSTKRYSGPQVNNNCTIHEHLHNLKDLRPQNVDIPLPVKVPVRYNYEASGSRQRTIKELLCSTMIYPEASLSKLRKDDKTPANRTTDDLFTDLDPETTFDVKQAHRTYVRPKRKRKQRHEFLLFHNSDVSDDEEESRDKNSEDEACNKRNKKSKKNRENENSKALNEFVTSFNAICKEVEQFELLVE